MEQLKQLNLVDAGPVLQAFFHSRPEVAEVEALQPLLACLLVKCQEQIRKAASKQGFQSKLDLEALVPLASQDELQLFMKEPPEKVKAFEVFAELRKAKEANEANEASEDSKYSKYRPLLTFLEQSHLMIGDLFALLLLMKSTSGCNGSDKVAQWVNNPTTFAEDLEAQSINPKPQTPNPKPQTPNPKPQTPNPKPQTPNPKP